MSEPTLPSVQAAKAIWVGEPGAAGKVLVSLLERSAIVAPALWLAGVRDGRTLAKQTAAVVLVIEAVVLWQVRRQMDVKP